jgi:hypothetical protein
MDLKSIQASLNTELKNRFNLDEQKINDITSTGVNSITSGLKSFVMKNGTKEIEQIMFKEKSFEGSDLKQFALGDLTKSLTKYFDGDSAKTEQVASFSITHLIESLVDKFGQSGKSKDLDGIAEFLGIDKNIIKMANSGAAKFLGKFF